MKSFRNQFTLSNIFLVIILLEVFLMGSGRMIMIGPMTLRMVLFTLAMVSSLIYLFVKNVIDKQTTILLSIFFISSSVALLRGTINGADNMLILEDLKPLSFFLILIYFSINITDMDRVKIITMAIKTSALTLVAVYATILLLLYFNVIEFLNLYDLLSKDSSFIFRGADGLFFYSGFLYLCIGFIFFMFSSRLIDKLLGLLMFIAIVLSFTRGFLLATVMVVAIYFIFMKKSMSSGILIVLIVFASLLLLPIYTIEIGDKTESDMIRITTFTQVIESSNIISILVGHGFGIGTPERPIHMESSLLEIFHKQGLLGLFFWFMIFYTIIQKYFKACRNNCRDLALPFFLSSVAIFIQTNTNPYMNNPIGMAMLLVTIPALDVLGKWCPTAHNNRQGTISRKQSNHLRVEGASS